MILADRQARDSSVEIEPARRINGQKLMADIFSMTYTKRDESPEPDEATSVKFGRLELKLKSVFVKHDRNSNIFGATIITGKEQSSGKTLINIPPWK